MAFDDRPNRWVESDMQQLSVVLAERIGLYFPPERFADLSRGLMAAATEQGFEDVADYTTSLLRSPITAQQVQVLASHLTIGETHFFRDPTLWDALRTQILPQIISARRGHDQRIRLWSAACASGEEAYSLAMLVDELLPDRARWHVTILATDINPRALRTAVAGVYGNWSFRGVPATVKERFFTAAPGGRLEIREPMRRLVTFEHLNLVDDLYPSVITGTNAMDVILCRNVLMYFMAPEISRVITKLHGSLIDGGWLAVSPSEASAARFPQFTVLQTAGTIIFRKQAPQPAASTVASAARSYAPPSPVLSPLPSRPSPLDVPERIDIPARARALANEGQLTEALACCDQWIAVDTLSAAAHYIRGMILSERGDATAARRSLQRTLYIDPTFVLAHVALGMSTRAEGQRAAAARHFANAKQLVEQLPPDTVLPESDGLTASRLGQTLDALTHSEQTS